MIGSIYERFWDKVAVAADDEGCWEWTASTNKLGYGWFGAHRKTHLAHRVSWELNVGPIPEGSHVLHRCDNPPCIRPGHLFLGTDADNMADMVAKRRHWRHGATHCFSGLHEWTEENIYIVPGSGARLCRLCNAASRLEWYEANRDRARAYNAAYRVANREDRNARERARRAAKRKAECVEEIRKQAL